MPVYTAKLEEDIATVLISEEQIAQRVAELGQQISQDYAGKDLMLVGILKGCALFLADLVRAIRIPVEFDFVAVSSYGADTKSSGVVRILKDLDESVESKHVLVVEDIVDTGLTLRLSYLLENLRSRRAASVKVCTLLDKPSRRRVDVPVDYRGFTVEDRFVVGYGMDYQDRYRSLPYIGLLKPEVYGGG
ncbi:MAG TPA: hypoxanthine phosphoribosyltransferase [Capsulimonadaceae bacterium]|nr:hypoxanthine phosphoribosyltransferase [Capsulimonadaceae bacterium]